MDEECVRKEHDWSRWLVGANENIRFRYCRKCHGRERVTSGDERWGEASAA
jgi:hypothetical protein